jgi:hypothetical protein
MTWPKQAPRAASRSCSTLFRTSRAVAGCWKGQCMAYSRPTISTVRARRNAGLA